MKTPAVRVLVIIHVKDVADIVYRCIEGVHAQSYRDFSLMIHEMGAVRLHSSETKDKNWNVVRNRNYVRPMALASGAEWIMWVDSDTVIPPNAIADFLRHAEKDGCRLMGGWYKMRFAEAWVAGRWAAPKVMRYFMSPQPGLVESDLIGIGCSMMHRSVLEQIEFRPATEEFFRDTEGHLLYTGDCLAFCEDARRIGLKPFMVGTIVCEHLPPPNEVRAA